MQDESEKAKVEAIRAVVRDELKALALTVGEQAAGLEEAIKKFSMRVLDGKEDQPTIDMVIDQLLRIAYVSVIAGDVSTCGDALRALEVAQRIWSTKP